MFQLLEVAAADLVLTRRMTMMAHPGWEGIPLTVMVKTRN